MDARRIPPKTDTTAGQVRDLITRLGDTPTTPVLCSDAGYDPIALTHELTEVHTNIVVADPRRPGLLHRPHPHRHASGGPADTATGSASPTPTPAPPPTPSTPPPMSATAPSRSAPGTACTPNSAAVNTGPTTTSCRS